MRNILLASVAFFALTSAALADSSDAYILQIGGDHKATQDQAGTDNAVSAFIDSYVDGSVEGGSDVVYDLEADGVGLATSGGFIDDIQDVVDDYRQQIIDGDIEVPTAP